MVGKDKCYRAEFVLTHSEGGIVVGYGVYGCVCGGEVWFCDLAVEEVWEIP